MEVFSNWHDAYFHVSELLNSFYLRFDKKNVAQALYIELEKTEFFKYNSARLERNQEDLSERGLDPIQIFATFNFSRISHEKRINCINYLFQALGSNNKIDIHTSFEGVPSPVITKIIHYRGWQYQNQIWDLFHNILEYGTNGFNENPFELLNNWSGISIPSLTMFLFWVDSEQFLPLDQNTVYFLRSFDLLVSKDLDFKTYLNLCKDKRSLTNSNITDSIDSFRKIVKDAYRFSDKSYKGEILSGTTAEIISTSRNDKKSKDEIEKEALIRREELFKGFKIIAIRPIINASLSGTYKSQKHLKNLKEGQLYQFYKAFEFKDDEGIVIQYNEKFDLDIYSYFDEITKNNLNISISAIVGKNGSGKSTLIELLFLIINKLSIAKNINSTEELLDEEIFAELYFKSDKLYKISIGNSIEIFEYLQEGNNYTLINEDLGINEFNIELFCYSLIINYSIYGLNSKHIGPWIEPLFHKNDSYQVPIVLNPKRNDGIIDVNNEEDLAISRLLSNLIDPERIDFENEKVQELTDGAEPEIIQITFDDVKMDRKRKRFFELYKIIVSENMIETVVNHIDPNLSSYLPKSKQVLEYIFYKLVSIADTYPKYNTIYNGLPNWYNTLPEKLSKYINDLMREESHITFKLKRAINYLKFNLYSEKGEYPILDLSKKIRTLKETIAIDSSKSEGSLRELSTIELTPPSFLKIDIIFKHNGNFGKLSSGEKQIIFSVNSILYHLFNINSVTKDLKHFKYNSVNIIFDEVELYFHPEMQRKFIELLLDDIKNLKLNEINNLNIIFVTHSPFILSDIPSNNVIMLRKLSNESYSPEFPRINTLGANIHELLSDSFFLDNTTGSFALKNINEILEFHHKVRSSKKDQIEILNQEFLSKKEKFKLLIENIGEDFMRSVLSNHLQFIEDYFKDEIIQNKF